AIRRDVDRNREVEPADVPLALDSRQLPHHDALGGLPLQEKCALRRDVLDEIDSRERCEPTPLAVEADRLEIGDSAFGLRPPDLPARWRPARRAVESRRERPLRALEVDHRERIALLNQDQVAARLEPRASPELRALVQAAP